MNLLILLLYLFIPVSDIQAVPGNQDSYPYNLDYQPLDELNGLEMGQSYWVKTSVMVPVSGAYVLVGGNPYMRNMKFYDETGQLMGQGNHVFLTLDNSPHTYYVFYPFADEKDKNLFSIEVLEQKQFLIARSNEFMLQFAFQAILVFVILISVFFGVSTGDKVYYFYALYLFSISWFFGYQVGFLGQVIPAVNQVPPMWFWLLAFTITLFYALFTIAFLDMRSRDVKALKVMHLGIGYMCFLFLVSTFCYLFRLDVQHSYWYKIPTIIIEFLLIGLALVRIWRFEGPVKKFYLVGVFVLISVSLVGQLGSMIQSVGEINDFVQAGLLLETFVLCIGLGVRVDQIQKSRNKSQRDYIEQLQLNENLQQTYTQQLEVKVRERTDSLDKRNKENELLLKEVHHRVKNNLQMVTSLINMQQRRLKDDSLVDLLTSTIHKIKSISLIHEHLYSKDRFSEVNMKEYIEQLLSMLSSAQTVRKQIKTKVKLSDIQVDLEYAIPIGLIVNELITNSMKYAFDAVEHPEVIVSGSRVNDDLFITLKDNGPGFSLGDIRDGLGFTIIKAILKNNNGELSFAHENGYFQVSISLSLIA